MAGRFVPRCVTPLFPETLTCMKRAPGGAGLDSTASGSRTRRPVRTATSAPHGGVMTDPAQMEMDELEEGTPIMQQVLDNPFLLLFLGIAMPTVLYIVWGVMEIVTIPVAK